MWRQLNKWTCYLSFVRINLKGHVSSRGRVLVHLRELVVVLCRGIHRIDKSFLANFAVVVNGFLDNLFSLADFLIEVSCRHVIT